MRAKRKILAASILALCLTTARTAAGQEVCPSGKVCVDKEDMPVLIEALKEKKCLLSQEPKVATTPITVITDRQGRIYASGNQPNPFTVHLEWCNYSIDAEGSTKILAAKLVEPSWGFRFRPKATVGILGTELLRGEKFTSTLDGGALLEPFYFHWVNLNAYVGIRSVGGGLGVDLTKNVGVNLSYAVTWESWRSNPFLSVSFALW